MKKLASLLSAAVLSSMIVGNVAFAEDQSNESAEFSALVSTQAPSQGSGTVQKTHTGPCSQINATDAQKEQIKTAVFQFAQTKITDKAAVATARLNYRKLVADANASYSDAQAAAAASANAISKLIADKLALKTQILFQILTPDQRKLAFKCEMLHKKMRRNRGNRSHRGQGGRSKGSGSAPVSAQ